MSSHSLKIAQFITQYPYPEQFDGGADYYCAGAARVAQQISEAFARKGHEVHVYTAADGPRYEETEQNGVIVHRSPSITRINTTEIPHDTAGPRQDRRFRRYPCPQQHPRRGCWRRT